MEIGLRRQDGGVGLDGGRGQEEIEEVDGVFIGEEGLALFDLKTNMEFLGRSKGQMAATMGLMGIARALPRLGRTVPP